MAAATKHLLANDTSHLVATGTSLTAAETCQPYELLLCSDGTSSGLGLRDDDNPDGATTGNVVEYPEGSGVCYHVGCRKCDLTPTESDATKQASCETCGLLYQITPCCLPDGGPSTIGLRPADLPAGVTFGGTVANPADGKCYTVGDLVAAAGLTPTTTPWYSITGGCESDDCPPCPSYPRLKACCCISGEPDSGFGLRPEDTPEGAGVGDTVLYDGHCYVIGESETHLTPTSSAATSVEDCNDDQCPECVCDCRNCLHSDGPPDSTAAVYNLHVPAGTVTLPCSAGNYVVTAWDAFDTTLIYQGYDALADACFWRADVPNAANMVWTYYHCNNPDCTDCHVDHTENPSSTAHIDMSWDGCGWVLSYSATGGWRNNVSGTRPLGRPPDPTGTFSDGSSVS